MKEHTFLKIVVIILLCINIGVINIMLIGRKKHHRHRGPAKQIIEQLELNKEQQEEYQQLILGHRADIEQYDLANINLKTDLYAMGLGDTVDSIRINEILFKIGQNQIAIEKIHLAHLADIKKLCTPVQKKNFDLLIKKFPEMFGRKISHPDHKPPH
jgi:hypothetical protein